MRPRSLLILLVIVLGLGAFIWFYERELPSSEERATQAKKVLQLKKEDVKSVSIELGGKRLDFERVEPPKVEPLGGDKKEDKKEKDGEEEPEEPSVPVVPEAEWRITRPLAARADAFAVDGLLESLMSLEKTRTLEAVIPAEVGLDKPQAIVRLRTAEGEQVLRFGSKTPAGSSVIAAIQGEPGAYVVSDSVLAELGKEPGSWRDRRLFHADRDAVQRVNLTVPGQRVVLVKRGTGFHLESPVSDQADRERLDELFSDLTGLSAETFIDAPGHSPAEMGLQPPRATVEVAVQGKPALRIELGGPVEGAAPAPEGAEEEDAASQGALLYARVGGQLVEARTRLADLAQRPAAGWRSSLLSAFEAHQIDHVTVKDGQGSVELERAGTDWKRGDTKISYVPVSDLLFSVTGARADRLLAPAELKLGPPALTITLKGKDVGTETLTVFPTAAGQGTPARVSGRDATLLLPADKLREIQDRLATVRKAEKLEDEGEKK